MINWSQFSVDNGAIRDLKELLFLTAFKDPDINMTVTSKTGVVNGKKLGFINDLGDVGINHDGCSPTYSTINITGIEKKWELGTWEIAKHICYKELENTIAELSLNGGTDIAYLQDTPYWNEVLMPLMQKAIKEMFWRIVWFSNKEAESVSDSGVLTAGVNKDLFTMCDGLWKQLQAITATNASQKTEIAANSEATYALQKTKLRESGVAIGIVDNMLSDADSRIFDDPDSCIMMTNSLFKALRNDVVDKYGKTTMPFEQISSGIQLSEYDGQKIIVLDIWDRMIKKYEDSGTALNCPHRALVCSPNNLFVGTNDTKAIADLSINFNDETRYNNIYASSKIGTLVGEDSLIQLAI